MTTVTVRGAPVQQTLIGEVVVADELVLGACGG